MGKHATDLFATHAVVARVWTGICSIFDAAVGDDAGNDLGQITDAVVVGRLPHVESLVGHSFHGRLECGNEGAGDVLDVDDGSPRRSIRFHVNLTGGDRPGNEIVEDDVEAHARRNSIGG